MSNLTDFFPSSSGSSENNAWILLVGGGGGGGAGIRVCCYSPPGTGSIHYGCLGFGGGGGGVYVGGFQICPGVSYPVVVGAGGACGCMIDACIGEPGGAGSSGGLSRFGNCIVMGGGGSGTFCYQYCGPAPSDCRLKEGKIVPNKNGANTGTMMRNIPGGICAGCAYRNERAYMLTRNAIDGFRVDSNDSAGGGIQVPYDEQFAGCSPPSNGCLRQCVTSWSVANGYVLQCNPTKDSWELKSTFFGLKIVPDSTAPTCTGHIVYCCTPTTIPPGTNPGACGGDICAGCRGKGLGYFPAAGFNLGVSRNVERCQPKSPCCSDATGTFIPIDSSWSTCTIQLEPHIANTGNGGMNHICSGHPCYPILNTGFNCEGSPFFWSATGRDGVVYVVYDCSLGAASSTPGAVDCTPVTGPDGYRSYRYTSSGSFTL